MPVPVSVDAQIRRLEKHVRELQNLRTEVGEEVSVLVAEICNASMLLLDKAMNAIWAAKAQPSNGKKKPHVYFPVCESERKFFDRLRQYQMPSLKETDGELFALLEAVQPYRGTTWLPQAHKIAVLRHEYFPEISTTQTSGLGIGKGQNLYIESMTIGGSGNINFKGEATNRKTGAAEPLRVDFILEVKSMIEAVGAEPVPFCKTVVSAVRKLAKDIYRVI
ncbi:hypothetical protein R1T40_08740 [Tritonibacter scottomollicae]|uniref:Uncharacterized protein n=1 Tax=Tritonibacter scottomollicae TaxID=483013 RepID=A0ABZ0HIY6_TRISK|nr:hypothetical protein [Tritonibacter scottomollicae]WOI34798.1 hypothetical protein R1T40_08740 [Tritonibacter scottomollicae]